MILDHQYATGGRAGYEGVRGIPGRQFADVDVVKAVNVFRGQYRLGYLLLVQVPGQRQLHENAVDRIVFVERRDEIEHVLLCYVGRQRVLQRMEAAGFRGALLVAHVNLARRVFADDDHREARPDAVIARQCGRLLFDFLRQFSRFGLAVNANSTRHEPVSCGSKARAW